jgi:hypothetical protein
MDQIPRYNLLQKTSYTTVLLATKLLVVMLLNASGIF